MSAAATPIPPHRFAEAITELPLVNLHFKAAELRNSIHHLHSSNQQLKPFVDDGDQDCADAVHENESVIARMEERRRLLKTEVERRGFKWSDDEAIERVNEDLEMNGARGSESTTAPRSMHSGAANMERQSGGRSGELLNDEELARRLSERREDEGFEDDGVHL